MTEKIHIICSFVCLHCCERHRSEIGLSEELTPLLANETFEEIIDQLPEVLEAIEQDEFQVWVFKEFIYEHGQHDIRFFHTKVKSMRDIVELRKRHYKKVIANYEQYKDVVYETKKKILIIYIFKPPRRQRC